MDISSLISALKLYKNIEEKLNRIRLVDKKLIEKKKEVKVTQKDTDNVVKQLNTSHPDYLEILYKIRSKPNKRKTKTEQKPANST